MPQKPTFSTVSGSLRKLAKSGFTSYVEEPRDQWVLRQPAQLVIAVSQVGVLLCIGGQCELFVWAHSSLI